tara:strand:- start:52334 stop:52615 length:282 start_codon:yes stop_codon:yes gene_type:complete
MLARLFTIEVVTPTESIKRDVSGKGYRQIEVSITTIFTIAYFLILNMIMRPSSMYLFIFLVGSVIIEHIFNYYVRVAYCSLNKEKLKNIYEEM